QHQQVDLNVILDEVRQSMLAAPDAPEMRISSGKLPSLTADRLQMLRLFRGLIDHALRYRGGDIPSFRFSVSRQIDKQVYTFTMVDNGKGIDDEDIQRIFRIFRKDLMLEQDKVSMGLALCKKIVANHGGRFWLTSSAGKGTSYFFTLPFGESATQRTSIKATQRA
ncbi:MAG: ATP-binding protein, partial [Bacteroidota bacterium]